MKTRISQYENIGGKYLFKYYTASVDNLLRIKNAGLNGQWYHI